MNKLALLWHYLGARRNFTRWRSRSDLLAWQTKQVRPHVSWVAQHSPAYARHWQGYDLADWTTLPIADKSLLMGQFDDWNTVDVTLEEATQVAEQAERTRDFSPSLKGVTVGLSSGTSGSRGIFLASDAERARWAGTLLARVLNGTLHHRHRAALFLRADSSLYRSIGSRRFQFEFFDLLQPMQDHIQRLTQLRPTILAAPPIVLSQLAALPNADQILAPPHILLSVADVLDDTESAKIAEGFRQPMGQLYQATEGFLAATCIHGTLHWNEDAISIQKDWLDAAKTRYSPIITDFRRTSQPIVRFRLNDVILPHPSAEPCPCGSRFETIGKIEGRQDDVLFLPRIDSSGWVHVYPDFVRRMIILAVPDQVDYTVSQTAVNEWSIELSRPGHEAEIQREATNLCTTLLAQCPLLIFRPLQPPPPHEKRRRVRRLITEPS